MTRVSGIRKRCDGCQVAADVHCIDGQYVDPPSWIERGEKSLCPKCSKKSDDVGLHPEVLKAAEDAVHMLQALMATELSAQTSSQSALVLNTNSMARRMKRCELLAKYADVIMTVYGNRIGFRLASAGAFSLASFEGVATALETLMKAEIAFSQARAQPLQHTPRSKLQRSFLDMREDSYTYSADDSGINIAGPLFRLQEMARLAQKFAQLAVTRVGEIRLTKEDEVLDDALENQGSLLGRVQPFQDGHNAQRELMMIAQQFLQAETKRRDMREAKAGAGADEGGSPLDDVERLLDLRAKFLAAGRTEAVKALDAQLAIAEQRLKANTDVAAVDNALVAESYAKDVTPTPFDPPPTPGELEHLRRTLGDAAVDAAFPTT